MSSKSRWMIASVPISAVIAVVGVWSTDLHYAVKASLSGFNVIMLCVAFLLIKQELSELVRRVCDVVIKFRIARFRVRAQEDSYAYFDLAGKLTALRLPPGETFRMGVAGKDVVVIVTRKAFSYRVVVNTATAVLMPGESTEIPYVSHCEYDVDILRRPGNVYVRTGVSVGESEVFIPSAYELPPDPPSGQRKLVSASEVFAVCKHLAEVKTPAR